MTGAESYWVSDIERQSESYDFDDIQFSYYHALRSIGVSVDFVGVDADFDAYKRWSSPPVYRLSTTLLSRNASKVRQLLFLARDQVPRRTSSGIRRNLPPGPLQRIAPLRVLSVETLRPDCVESFFWNGKQYDSLIWREELDAPDSDVLATYDDGAPAVVRYGNIIYTGTLTETDFLQDFFRRLCEERGIATHYLEDGVRIEQRGQLVFAFNYSEQEQELPLGDDAEVLLGSRKVKPHDITVWRPRV